MSELAKRIEELALELGRKDAQIAALQAQQAMHAKFWALKDVVLTNHYRTHWKAEGFGADGRWQFATASTPDEAIAALLAQVEESK